MSAERYLNPPGAPQSVRDGCTCPVEDNGYGAGIGYVDAGLVPLFVFDDACPLHGGDRAEEMDPETPCFKIVEVLRRIEDLDALSARVARKLSQ